AWRLLPWPHGPRGGDWQARCQGSASIPSTVAFVSAHSPPRHACTTPRARVPGQCAAMMLATMGASSYTACTINLHAEYRSFTQLVKHGEVPDQETHSS